MNQCSSVFEIEELIRLSAYREKSCGPKFSVTYSAACCEVCVVVMQSDIVFLFRQSLLQIFFFFAWNPKEPQTNRACFEKKKKASLQTPLFLFSWIRPSQLRSINTTEPAAPAAEWGLSAVGSVQWKRPTANDCYVSLLRVDSLVDQEHLGQSRIY